MTTVSTHQPFHVAEWLNTVYCHKNRPPAKQRDVLTALVVKFLDWETGKGFASIQQLADFCEVGRATVQRALRWGCRMLLIMRAKRGCRRGDGTLLASEWKLQIPSLGISTPAVENRL